MTYKTFHPSASEITLATIDLYHLVIQKMLPTPTKMHYLFNLRDISKVNEKKREKKIDEIDWRRS